MLDRSEHGPVGGLMEDDLASFHRLVDHIRVGDVALDQLRRRIDVLPVAGRQVVEHDHVVAVGDQSVDQVGPDEAGPAGHECAHTNTPSIEGTPSLSDVQGDRRLPL